MEDIFEQYNKLSRTFSDENLDVKKAEQSLFLIETNLNNLLTRETQISDKFLEYKDRFLQRENLNALEIYISNLNDSSPYERLTQQNFDQTPIDTNIQLFSQINSLLDSIKKSNESLKFKETLITQMSKIAKNLSESERAFANLKNNQRNNVSIDELIRLKAGQNHLIEDLTLLRQTLETQNMIDHPFINNLENKVNEGTVIFENQFNTRIKKVLKSEYQKTVINTDELIQFTQNKAFFDGNRKISESLIELIEAINTALIETLKKDAKLSLDIQKKYIYVSEDEAFYDMDDEKKNFNQLQIAQIFSNFDVVYDASQTIKDIINRNIALASLKKEINKTFEKFDMNLLQTLNDVIFPHIREGKDEILKSASQIEEKYQLNLQSLKEICQNFEFIEIFNANEKYLVEWKNDFFMKIQAIQANSDSKNNENFYRKVVEVVDKLRSFTTSVSEISNQELQRKFAEFEISTLKLIVLVIKIVDEENARKKMQWQILNLRSSCFVVIQDLILILLSLTQENKISETYNEELMKFVRYFNAQEIDTWIDFKNLNINST